VQAMLKLLLAARTEAPHTWRYTVGHPLPLAKRTRHPPCTLVLFGYIYFREAQRVPTPKASHTTPQSRVHCTKQSVHTHVI
jgi:hypothetical protein